MSFAKSLLQGPSYEDIVAKAKTSAMKRTLTGLDVTLIGVGEIIGAGIFVITGTAAARFAGPAIVLSFIISGVACAFAGLCYSEMAAAIPASGSAYSFATVALGEALGFTVGWDLMLEYLVGAATVAVGWSAYLVKFLKAAFGVKLSTAYTSAPIEFSEERGFYMDETTGIINLPAVLVVMFCTAALCFGVKQSAIVNHLLVATKLAVIMLFIFSSFAYIKVENWSPFIPGPDAATGREYGVSGILRASTLVFFAYIGFDAVSTTAQEVKRPSRDLPIGILGSLSLCTVIYIVVSLCLTGITNYKNLDSAAPLADAVTALGMNWLSILVSVGGLAGLTSVILVSLLSQPRIFYSLAVDGLLPPMFGKIHPKFGTPFVQTLFSGVFCAVAAAFLPLGVLGELTSSGTLFCFAAVCISTAVLRFKRPDIERPFRMPGGPLLIPVLGAASSFALIISTGWSSVLRLGIWMLVGLCVYFAYGYRHSVMRTGKAVEGLASADKFGGGHDATYEKVEEKAEA
ncbi:hypothetical protein H9P43_007386 [Blastocladiella emersonii ATCC 22665]|nr:hypothetical protein H9P43_007368 [Blastocladiella emersonii ATCC 22665]KAI9173255.1 hypothetical protein H9P43_007386 [Blastocladiella emersonii ATCC 22665]